MDRNEILDLANEAVNRGKQYGKVEDNFGNIASLWGAYLGKDLTTKDIAIMMILFKVARLKGNPHSQDSWVDIAGCAACGGETKDVYKEGEDFRTKWTLHQYAETIFRQIHVRCYCCLEECKMNKATHLRTEGVHGYCLGGIRQWLQASEKKENNNDN